MTCRLSVTCRLSSDLPSLSDLPLYRDLPPLRDLPMSPVLTEAVAAAVAEDPQLRATALALLDRLSASILQYARSAWGPQGPEAVAGRSSGYGYGGYGHGYGYGPSPLDTALSSLALLAFALFFINSILPLLTGGGTGTGTGTGCGRSGQADDPLPLDLTQEALNLITSWVHRDDQRSPDRWS